MKMNEGKMMKNERGKGETGAKRPKNYRRAKRAATARSLQWPRPGPRPPKSRQMTILTPFWRQNRQISRQRKSEILGRPPAIFWTSKSQDFSPRKILRFRPQKMAGTRPKISDFETSICPVPTGANLASKSEILNPKNGPIFGPFCPEWAQNGQFGRPKSAILADFGRNSQTPKFLPILAPKSKNLENRPIFYQYDSRKIWKIFGTFSSFFKKLEKVFPDPYFSKVPKKSTRNRRKIFPGPRKFRLFRPGKSEFSLTKKLTRILKILNFSAIFNLFSQTPFPPPPAHPPPCSHWCELSFIIIYP